MVSEINIHYSLEKILWAFGGEYPVPLEKRAEVMTNLLMKKMNEP